MIKLAAGLNEMRDTLIELSTLIKDYKATVDWYLQGTGMLKGHGSDIPGRKGKSRVWNATGRLRLSSYYQALATCFSGKSSKSTLRNPARIKYAN